ncbi:Ig-like domain-containing protein [Paenibacillus radicis (ex Xue et al. 2023)]|uniref:Uncharacterized protein n=1 Tax=Paenibacillus radicis (ex Xue et al. 2023) TaxID=2972489 RepID=A0ABT1YU42_9BACL|nr:Ig-like domain-containing protein [Paenibacillus radicis (ex Xue et al. 2023)]MCR8636708.1 hypothetical protein [Paenibacillus radicis (ex Xue et al. 2023)]
MLEQLLLPILLQHLSNRSYGHPIKPHPIATGYFNADGKPDVAVISSEYIQSSYLLSIYLNNHIPTITNNTLTGTQNEILAFVKTDFKGNNSDGDGDPISGVTVVSLPANGTSKLNGSPVNLSKRGYLFFEKM